ncbi:MAG: alpha/beta fold hydrolase [Chitinophagaceae bacterium]
MSEAGNNIKIAINDISVSYNDSGSDNSKAIIFIHGFPFNKSMWDKQAAALKGNYRVIAYDVRGHGNTNAGDGIFSIDLFVADLIGLMDNLKLDKVVLCGLSMGGYIALKAIEKFPERFEALVLSDTQCAADTEEGKAKRLKTIEHIKEISVEEFADESINNLFAPESFLTKKDVIAAVREMIVNTSKLSLMNTLLAISERANSCSKLQEINVPVLIMVGKEDIITPPATAWLMHGEIKQSKLTIIEHAGHLANLENPYEFNYQLKSFLQEHIKKTVGLHSSSSL